MSNDPLLQPFTLKHLTLRNRLLLTSHEPAYGEDGLPKDRYRAYHVERARAGVALTMTAGSAAVSRDSPPVFNNILAWKDEVVGWMKKLTDECHDHGCAVMIQLTHLGRRTRWDKADWLPVVSPSHEREAAHRSFPKKMEDWDIARIIGDYVDAAERMKAAGRPEAKGHRRVYRPWGHYEGLIQGERFQVKKIQVRPGQKLSLQKHFHRAEHWVVVNGTAVVERDNESILLRENESVYLPLGCVHRLANPGMIPLNLIEVQSGAYLGEDDIVRIEDTYGRA